MLLDQYLLSVDLWRRFLLHRSTLSEPGECISRSSTSPRRT